MIKHVLGTLIIITIGFVYFGVAIYFVFGTNALKKVLMPSLIMTGLVPLAAQLVT